MNTHEHTLSSIFQNNVSNKTMFILSTKNQSVYLELSGFELSDFDTRNCYLICVVCILDVSSGMFVIIEACVRTKYEIFR